MQNKPPPFQNTPFIDILRRVRNAPVNPSPFANLNRLNTPFSIRLTVRPWVIVVFVILIVFMSGIFFGRSFGFSGNQSQVTHADNNNQPNTNSPQNIVTTVPTDTPLPTQTPTPLPTDTPTPTPTPLPPPPGTILYQADWSKWTLNPHWSISKDIIINDGNDSYSNWLAAPYQPNTNDYAVESEMRIDRGCNANGVVARAVGSNNYSAGAYCIAPDVEIWLWGNNATSHQDLAHYSFNVGTDWHVYRLEVKGNVLKLFIDGIFRTQTIDDTILSGGGQVGLWSQSEQLEVRSFKVIAL